MRKLIALTVALSLLLIGCASKQETIRFHDRTFVRAELSEETVRWLERYNGLSEKEQMSIDYVPPELLGLTGGEISASTDAVAEVKWALIPMVMVNGELYLDTGYESTEPRCGMMDGTITSSVDGSEKPAKDDQSNFGKGYGYQYGTEGTVEICMDGIWRIFATEEKRQELQFPGRVESLETGDAAAVVSERAQIFSDILENGIWIDGTADCLNDYLIALEEQEYYYHADCGTVNDIVNERSMKLTDEEKAKFDAVLKLYFSLPDNAD